MAGEVKQGQWKGYKSLSFKVGDNDALIILPRKAVRDNPWIWRTEFLGAFDQVDLAMLEKGWHLGYVKVSDMYGCPEAIEIMHKFYLKATEEFNLNGKVVLFGFSRGGLYAINYALKYENEVGALYLDAPVIDMRSWPGGLGKSKGSPQCWEECLSCYGLGGEMPPDFRLNPINRIDELVRTGIPVISVVGDGDENVPYDENTLKMERIYEKHGKKIEVIVKKGVGHHPHSLTDPTPIVDFILGTL